MLRASWGGQAGARTRGAPAARLRTCGGAPLACLHNRRGVCATCHFGHVWRRSSRERGAAAPVSSLENRPRCTLQDWLWGCMHPRARPAAAAPQSARAQTITHGRRGRWGVGGDKARQGWTRTLHGGDRRAISGLSHAFTPGTSLPCPPATSDAHVPDLCPRPTTLPAPSCSSELTGTGHRMPGAGGKPQGRGLHARVRKKDGQLVKIEHPVNAHKSARISKT